MVSSVGNIRVGLGIKFNDRELQDLGFGLGTNLGLLSLYPNQILNE